MHIFILEFSQDEKKRAPEEMASFERELDDELVREQERHKRNVSQLNQRKDDMIADRKKKMKEELERLKVASSTFPVHMNHR